MAYKKIKGDGPYCLLPHYMRFHAGVWELCWSEEGRIRSRSLGTGDLDEAALFYKRIVPGLRPPKPHAQLSEEQVTRWARKAHHAAKYRASLCGVPFEITQDRLRRMLAEADGRCAVTGLAFDFQADRHNPWCPSLDRIKPALGYVEGNCRWVCFAVNLAMNKWGEDVLVRIAVAIATKLGRRTVAGTPIFARPRVLLPKGTKWADGKIVAAARHSLQPIEKSG